MQYRVWLIAGVCALALLCHSERVCARSFASDAAGFAATLQGNERKAFESYIAATVVHGANEDSFWRKVETVKKQRKARRSAGKPLRASDYVQSFPPKYKGPGLSSGLNKRWGAYRARLNKKKPQQKSSSLPKLEDFLAYSVKHFGFRPDRVSEREFKNRYAREALRLGLTKEQVVRVYAFETSGQGTADMVAGMGKVAYRGRPISTAIGYAQLLVANTVDQLGKNGRSFVARLQETAARRDISSERRARLRSKIAALKKMVAFIRSYKVDWGTYLKLARTQKGRAVHAINVDADLGPWLQVIKLKSTRDIAVRKGRANIQSHELELMNFAGPGTALEMMSAVGLKMPTVNFYARRAYEVNTVARGKTSQELLDDIKYRMDENSKYAGAVEFNAVFDEVAATRRARR